MITQAWLGALAAAGSNSQSFAIRQPAQYALPTLPTLVPTTLQLSYDRTSDMYAVGLADLVTAQAVPEPGTLYLLGLSAAAVIAWRRKTQI